MKYLIAGTMLAFIMESLGYTIIQSPPVVGDIAVLSLVSYIVLSKLTFCWGKGKHDWYISNTFPLSGGETQVYIKCRKCGAFEENSGRATPSQMLAYEKKHNACGCNG